MFAHIVTDVFCVLIPVRTVKHIDSEFAIFTIPVHILVVFGVLKVDTRRKCHKFCHICSVKVLFDLCQPVKHLRGSHRIPDVVNLLLLCYFLDLIDKGPAIVETKLSPTKIPSLEAVVIFVWELIALVAIFRTTVVSHPDIIAFVVEL